MRAVRRAEEPFGTVELVRQVLEARREMAGINGKDFRGEVDLSEVPLAIDPGGRIVRKGKPSEWKRDNRCWRRSDDHKQCNYEPVASPNLEIQPRGEAFSVLSNGCWVGYHKLART